MQKAGQLDTFHLELLTLNFFATVAQMVEQIIRNDQVVGSIPISGSLLPQDRLTAGLSNFTTKRTKEFILPADNLLIITPNKLKPIHNTMFPESALAHRWIDPIERAGGIGVEFGPASHNPFGFKNCIYADRDIVVADPYFQEQMRLAGSVQRVDRYAFLGEALPFDDGFFNYVASSHVLEHIWDLLGCFDEMRRIMRPGGKMVHILPHVDRTWDKGTPLTTLNELRDRNKPGVENPRTYGHHSFFNTESFLNIVSTIPYLTIEDFLDADDKVGNGFLVVFKVD